MKLFTVLMVDFSQAQQNQGIHKQTISWIWLRSSIMVDCREPNQESSTFQSSHCFIGEQATSERWAAPIATNRHQLSAASTITVSRPPSEGHLDSRLRRSAFPARRSSSRCGYYGVSGLVTRS